MSWRGMTVWDTCLPFIAVFCKLDRDLTFSGTASTMQEELLLQMTAFSATLKERAQLFRVNLSSYKYW
jgi:hypothetical protein